MMPRPTLPAEARLGARGERGAQGPRPSQPVVDRGDVDQSVRVWSPFVPGTLSGHGGKAGSCRDGASTGGLPTEAGT